MGCKEPGSSGGQQHQISELRRCGAGAGLPVLLIVILVALTDMTLAVDDSVSAVDIRSSIVEALGLQRIPDPAKANVSQTEYERAHKEYLTRLRRSAEGDARQRRLFTTYATGEPTYEGVELSFPMSVEKPENALVESASLRLLLDHAESDAPELEILVYRKQRSGTRQRLVSRRKIAKPESVQRRWLEFDVSDEVAAAAILEPQASLNLLVQVLRKDYLKDDVRPARSFSLISTAALNIHAFYPDGPHRRERRSLGQLMSLHRGRRTECRGESAKKCCRHRMTVTFKDLEGFDFIIQPKSFDAGYCKGRCPPRYNPAHHHALLQSLIWKEDRKKAPRPCCAPSKLAELEILYFDENDSTKLKVSNWKDMRVLECACS